MQNILPPAKLNPFLVRSVVSDNKGGGLFIEDPAEVQNVVFQTRGVELSSFEEGLAASLMQAFAAGHVDLPALVAALNASGSTDRDGGSWTPQALEAQLALSAAQLFVVADGGGDA